MELSRTKLRAIIGEVTKLPKEHYTEIDRVVQDSQFWKEDNSSHEVLVRRGQPQTDAYAHEAAELLVDEFGHAGSLEILRRPVDITDERLPTALTKYAEIGEPETMKKVKGKIYKYIESFNESFLRGYVREVLSETL